MRTKIIILVMLISFCGVFGSMTIGYALFGWEDSAQSHLDTARSSESSFSVWRELAIANEICVDHDIYSLVEYTNRAESINCSTDVCEQNHATFELQMELRDVSISTNNLDVALAYAFLFFIPVFIVLGLDGMGY